MNNTSISAVIFDMDGLMIDSEPFHCMAFDSALKKFGSSLSKEENNANYVGIGDVAEATDLIKKRNLKISYQELLKLKNAEYLKIIKNNLIPMPGLLELVEYLYQKKYDMAVASGSSLDVIELVTDKFQIKDKFKVFFSSENLPAGKPNPDVFLQTAKLLNYPPANCLVLEDAPSGLQAAKSAGMKCIIVPSRETRTFDFSSADFVLNNLKEVIDILK